MKIAVVGTGYVGLVTGTCFAETGNTVSCVDVDSKKIEAMNNGVLPIYEPDLDVLFTRNIKDGRLNFSTNLEEGIADAKVIFLALPTPAGEDGSADLSYILNVANKLGSIISSYSIIVDKSTVPVGTAEKVHEQIAQNAKVDFDVVSNPEFLREGFAVSDFMKPDRIIIGSSSEKANTIIEMLYRPFVRQGNPIFFMDERSAELTKYTANSFLATKISFMNEMANLCEKVGADVDAVRLGIGADERIGKRFLFPGIGYGGSCFPKDVLALRSTAIEHGQTLEILKAVTNVNAHQKQLLVKKILDFYTNNIRDKTFALWGLSFKPDTDDVREAPALEIIRQLTAEGVKIVAFDPEATENAKAAEPDNAQLSYVDDAYEALSDADGLIIATEWSEFRNPDFEKIKQLLREPIIFDGRNVYDLDVMKDMGIYYESIGRRAIDGR